MIKEIQVENWKSFEKATFYINPLTILIGANASGKSNLLDALLFLQRISSNINISQAINGDLNLPALRGGFEWVCRKPNDKFTVKAIIEKSERQDYQYIKNKRLKQRLHIISKTCLKKMSNGYGQNPWVNSNATQCFTAKKAGE